MQRPRCKYSGSKSRRNGIAMAAIARDQTSSWQYAMVRGCNGAPARRAAPGEQAVEQSLVLRPLRRLGTKFGSKQRARVRPA
jgi:hypothetical protein